MLALAEEQPQIHEGTRVVTRTFQTGVVSGEYAVCLSQKGRIFFKRAHDRISLSDQPKTHWREKQFIILIATNRFTNPPN